MKQMIFTGAATALVTPFHGDGSIAWDELERLVELQIEGGMAVSIGRLRPDTQYDYKFVCLSHNTLRGAAGGAVLLAELLCAKGYMDAQ